MRTYSKPILLIVFLALLHFNHATAAQDQSRIPSKTEAKACIQLAQKYLYSKPDSSLYFGKLALALAKRQNQPNETIRALNSVAKTYYVIGSFFESLTYADSALVLSKAIGFQPGLANAINTRGLIYLGQDRMQDAITEFKKALRLNIQLKDSSRIAANYFNIGISYEELHQFKEAFAQLKKALKVAQDCHDGHIHQMALNRIGETYYDTQNYTQALGYFRSALSFTAYQDEWEQTFAYSGMARTLYKMKQFPEALEHANQSYRLAVALKTNWDMERAVNILSKCYAALGQYQEAYRYQALSRAYADSILDEKKEKEINYLHLQDKKAENLALTEENEDNRQIIKNRELIIVITTLFACVVVVVLIILKRQIVHKNLLNLALQKSNQEIALQKEEIQTQREALITMNQTKDRVLSVIGHDLRSPFASILQALALVRSGDLDEDEQEQIWDGFQRQISLVSGLIHNLLAWANSQQTGAGVNYTTINLAETTENVLLLYQATFQQKKQRVQHEAPNPVYVEADQNHVQIILQNIISNAIKFTPEHGIIKLFYSQEDGMNAIHIQDDGKGMSPEKLGRLFQSSGQAISEPGTNNELGTGLGLLLIKQFIGENQGRIEVRSEIGAGTEFIIFFKSSLSPKN